MQEFIGTKIVEAGQITEISVGEEASTLVLGRSADSAMFVVVETGYMLKHEPQVGGYYVRYPDGYESYSPADAFEAAYKPVTDVGKLNQLARMIDEFAVLVHADNKAVGWWDNEDPHTIPAKMMLIVSEISEAVEGHRKGLADDHLPQHPMVAVELADAFIRILDMAGRLNVSLGTITMEKRAYNAVRADHKRKNRAAEGGKKY